MGASAEDINTCTLKKKFLRTLNTKAVSGCMLSTLHTVSSPILAIILEITSELVRGRMDLVFSDSNSVLCLVYKFKNHRNLSCKSFPRVSGSGNRSWKGKMRAESEVRDEEERAWGCLIVSLSSWQE